MLDFIAYPIGYILKFIYDNLAFQNYGIAIILLTLVIKLILMPTVIKQQKSTSKLNNIQSDLKKIQIKYKGNAEKMNQETMDLYKLHKVSPFSSLMPMIIQMPILFSLYYVISQPLKYMLGKSPEVIQRLFELIPAEAVKIAHMKDLTIINYFSTHTENLSSVSTLLSPKDLLNMDFWRINLGAVPTWNLSALTSGPMATQNLYLLLIPVFAVLTTYISTKVMMSNSPKPDVNQTQSPMLNSMTLVSPLITGFLAFSVPAGLGLYWIIGNVFQIAQQLIVNFIRNKGVKEEGIKDKKVSSTKNIKKTFMRFTTIKP